MAGSDFLRPWLMSRNDVLTSCVASQSPPDLLASALYLMRYFLNFGAHRACWLSSQAHLGPSAAQNLHVGMQEQQLVDEQQLVLSHTLET